MQQSGMIKKMFADPKKFVSTFENADPSQIDEVVEILKTLLDEGQEALKKATDENNLAQKEALDAAKELQTATDNDNLAVGLQQEKIEAATTAKDDRDKALEDLNKQQQEKEKAENLANDASEGLKVQEAIVAKEKETLEEIEKILKRLVERTNGNAEISISNQFFRGRSLLATIGLNANAEVSPTTVNRIQEIIDKIRKEGEDSLAALGKTRDETAEKFKTELDKFDAAQKLEGELKEKLDAANAAVDAAKAAVQKTTADLVAATEKDTEKKAISEGKKKTLDSVTETTSNENSVITDVIQRLETLKG